MPAAAGSGRPPASSSLRFFFAAKTARDSGLDVAPSQVIVTNGGKQAVYQAFQAVVNPGDEVLLPAPYWTTYPEAIRLAGGVPVDVFAGADLGPTHRAEVVSLGDLVYIDHDLLSGGE